MPDERISQPWTPLLTPAQHLAMAEMILELSGNPGAPTKERAEQMARNHRIMAKLIANRQERGASSPALRHRQ